ncbi:MULTISPECIES: PQ-loop domain-containing transporter [Enterococcus]|uniref:PQ-loop domain-containing transporter n=1 Tax=Enterococcus TaxID=1350 RepID=UPI0038CD436C
MIGLIAASLTTLAFLPQVVKVMRTKETKGLSTLMCLMQVAGIGLWAIHGLCPVTG